MALAAWHTTITDLKGNVIPNARVEVRDEETGTLAVLFKDRNGTVGLGNPFQADGEGLAVFFCIGGAYRVTATGNGGIREWRYVGVGTAQETDIDELLSIVAEDIFDDKSVVMATEIQDSVNAIRLNGSASVGDGLGGLYVDVDNGSTDTVVSGDGRTWYRVRDVGLDRLGDDARKFASTPSFHNAHRKSIKLVLPIEFPDYQAIVTQQGYTYIYPQCMQIDEVASEVFVIFESVGNTDRLRWCAVFDWNTGEYKSCFAAGIGAGEGAALRWEGSERFLYVIYDANTLGKFDVTTLPVNRSVVTPESTRPWIVGIQFSEYSGKWVAETFAQPVGVKTRRTQFARYNDNLVKTGTISFDLVDTGYGLLTDSDLATRVPKRQSLALGNGIYVGLYGGIYRQGVSPLTYYNHQGIKVFNGDGSKAIDAIYHPQKFMDILSSKVQGVSRIEAEGVQVIADTIYSLFVTDGVGTATSKSSGMVVFKEFSGDAAALDFSEAATVYPTYGRSSAEGGVFPRSTGGDMFNPLTGAKFETVDQILDFMIETDTRKFSFYSSSVTIQDIDGTTIPTSIFVEVINANNFTFYYNWTSLSGSERKIIFGNSGSRTVNKLRDDLYGTKLRLASSEVNSQQKFGRILSRHFDNSKPDILGVDINSNNTSTIVSIGGGSSEQTAATNVRLVTAPGINDIAGSTRWVVTSGGHLNPGVDDTYQIGVGSARVKEIYAASGTINTSDARKKTEVYPLNEGEISASIQLSKEIGIYKFLSAVSEKGSHARKHIGLTVQRAIEVMEDNGLDPMAYGFICYDEWDERQAEHDDEGNEIELYRAAGSIYSFRHDQLLLFIARGIDARLTALEAKK